MASTFATNAAQWRIRTGGSALNGGGFNPFIANVGTDYSDQDAAQLSLTDLTTAGVSATVGSVTGGFTAAMIGNVMRIASGTNFTADYYVIVSVASTNAATLDRTCATGVGVSGVCRVGGAFASLEQFCTAATGTLNTPTLATPLLPGNRIYIRGTGSLDPNTATYDYSGGILTFPDGERTAAGNGDIHLIGYNGRPRIDHQGRLGDTTNWTTKHLSFFRKLNTNPLPVFTSGSFLQHHATQDCIYDSNGFDVCEYGGAYGACLFSEFRNTGGGSAGTACTIQIEHPGNAVIGNYVHGVRGTGIATGVSIPTTFCSIAYNTVVNCGADGIFVNVSNAPYLYAVFNNTIDGCGGNGIKCATGALACSTIFNNCLSNNTGSAIFFIDGYTLNRRIRRGFIGANNFYNNGSIWNQVGGVDTWVLASTDLQVDPQYVNRAGGNYATGINLRNKGVSGLGGVGGTVGAAVNHVNMGMYQGPSAPSAPTIGTAIKGNASASVAFTASVENGGSTITGYTATSTPGGFTGTGASSPITVSGLTNGTSYTFTVHATNAVGNSAESGASNAVTPSTVPSAPTIGTAAVVDSTHVNVPFTAGANGGSVITSYTATSSPGGFTGTLSQAGSGTVSVAAAYTLGQAYTFTVHATNANGNSIESAASNSVIPNSSVVTILVTLTDSNNQPIPGLSSLKWAWWDDSNLETQTAPDDGGTGASTNGGGVFSVASLPGSSLSPGQVGWLEITNSDGTTSQSPVPNIAAGPITVH